MCFTINYENNREQVATRDIVCYKYMNISLSPKKGVVLRSGVLDYRYYLGKLVTSSFVIHNQSIHQGLHSYKKKSFGNVKCIIPKGALYYENEEEYCSNEIKVVSIFPNVLRELAGDDECQRIKTTIATYNTCITHLRRTIVKNRYLYPANSRNQIISRLESCIKSIERSRKRNKIALRKIKVKIRARKQKMGFYRLINK